MAETKSKSKTSRYVAASISFPADEKQQYMEEWDRLLAQLGHGKTPMGRSQMVQSVIKNGRVVGPEDLAKLAEKAGLQKRKYVIFWVD